MALEVFWSSRQTLRSLFSHCEFTHSEVCSVQVQLINDAYNLVIDAMLGPEADQANIKEPYSGILVTLKQIKTPIVSVDVPSGKCFVHTVEIRTGGSETQW